MVDREQGRVDRDERSIVEDIAAVSHAIAQPAELGVEETAAVRHDRFLAALDEVMADHHNVLAALAK